MKRGTLTEAEEEAVIQFCEAVVDLLTEGEGPGPLSAAIPAMQGLVRKILLSQTTIWRGPVAHTTARIDA